MRNMTIPQVQKMVGTTFMYHHDLMKEVSVRCREIRDTGEYHSVGGGAASCALS